MIPKTRRVLSGAVIAIACLTPSVFGEILEYQAAFRSGAPAGAGATATFTAVEAEASTDIIAPARAFAGGFFSGPFGIGNAPPLDNQNGEDGVLAGLSFNFAANVWNVDFLLHAASDRGNCRINDVAIADDGLIFVTGTFLNDVTFDQGPVNAIVLTSQPDTTEGFVAWADPAGAWIDAFKTDGMQPESIALDAIGDIYLTGQPILARKYAPSGVELWDRPAQQGTTKLSHIVVERESTEGAAYVTGAFDPDGDGTNDDVFLIKLNPNDGIPNWNRVVRGPRLENPGGLGIGPGDPRSPGDIRLSFSSGSPAVTFDGIPLQSTPDNIGRYAYLLFIKPDGSLERDFILAQGQAGGIMDSTDLAIDHAGTAYVAVNFNGDYSFETVRRRGTLDTAIIAVDPAGELFRFSDSSGPGQAMGNAVAAPGRNLQIVVGGLRGDEDFDGITLTAPPDERAFFASLTPVPNQNAFIVFNVAGLPSSEMANQIHRVDGEVFRTVQNPRSQFVAAFMTFEQLGSLPAPYRIELDVELFTDGTVLSSGWALAHLNAATPGGNGPPFNYTYPDTCAPTDTTLYLIDTAIDNSSGYFDGNPNLTLGASTLVRSTGDPLVSTKFDHGTEMLSMIAGPTYGVAQGTPIEVINYDIYPDGISARLSALVEAIDLASSHKLTFHSFDPAVVCVASSATSPSVTSTTLGPAVDDLIGSMVRTPMIISAGNTAGDAVDYTPSYLGDVKAGVICAGAIDIDNTQVPVTRGGSGVNIWAPGDTVPAADTSGLATTVSGTSASTALATGVALIYVSTNPFVEPAAVKTAMIANGSAAAVGDILQLSTGGAPWFTSFSDFGDWNLLADKTTTGNSDGDLWTNEEEFIWGFDPHVAESDATLATVSFDTSTSTFTFEFPLACYLYDSSVLTKPVLRDGSSLIIERSDDLDTWTDVSLSTTLKYQGHSGGQVTLSFDYTASTTPCFFRVRVQ